MFMFCEIFMVPNLLEMPAMLIVLVYMVMFMLPYHKVDSSVQTDTEEIKTTTDQGQTDEDQNCVCWKCRLIRWSTTNSRLLQITFTI